MITPTAISSNHTSVIVLGSKTDERRYSASAAKIGFIKALSSRNDDIVAYNAVIRLIVVAQSQEVARLKAMKELAGKHTMADTDLQQISGQVLFENAVLQHGQASIDVQNLAKRKDPTSMENSGSGSPDVPLSITSDVLAIRPNLLELLLTATEENGFPR
ncbi:hypothetical protein PHLCEN_2v13336 [Hermanssonia centrifuga]|uniref:Uncharacterized protein n=1 Tax=Hermanssonia centrifuga TaxID=98765 RepID=A0A2R6NEH1_9APHY|nr:hypothetical protein PHLCEN_2v13336 [Hermanssonia centrifuga]